MFLDLDGFDIGVCACVEVNQGDEESCAEGQVKDVFHEYVGGTTLVEV